MNQQNDQRTPPALSNATPRQRDWKSEYYDYREATENAIGIARLAFADGLIEKGKSVLDGLCDKLDKLDTAVIAKLQAETAAAPPVAEGPRLEVRIAERVHAYLHDVGVAKEFADHPSQLCPCADRISHLAVLIGKEMTHNDDPVGAMEQAIGLDPPRKSKYPDVTTNEPFLCHHTYATVTVDQPDRCAKCGGYVTPEHYKLSGYSAAQPGESAKEGQP